MGSAVIIQYNTHIQRGFIAESREHLAAVISWPFLLKSDDGIKHIHILISLLSVVSTVAGGTTDSNKWILGPTCFWGGLKHVTDKDGQSK